MSQSNCRERDLVIALANLPFMTAQKVKVLRSTFNSLTDINRASVKAVASLLSLPEEQARIARDPLLLPHIGQQVEAQRESVIVAGDATYPSLLAEISDPPAALFFRGDVATLSRPAIAIVGSRSATPYGVNVARRLARELASAGLAIVSGLARGIDAAAHEETLNCGEPTVAVLGTGVDVDYPREHRAMRARIETNGCIISEFPPGTTPRAMNFPIRNRIIAGLTLGTIVVEAANRSGSLITARLALEYGREVFALPGSIFSKSSEGSHRLIQSGAKLVHSAQDVIDELTGMYAFTMELRQHARDAKLGDDERSLLELLTYEEGTHVDAASAALGWTTSRLSSALLQLELSGKIRALPGQRYVRAS